MRSLFLQSIILIILIFPQFIFSQSIQLDSVQIERVARTCQLWGHLKYFHPYLDDNDINWEKAFTDNIELVITANNNNQFGKAVQKMLDALKDPATKVVMKRKKSANEDDKIKYPLIEFIQDSILLVTINNYKDLVNTKYVREQFLSLREKLPKCNGIIFDIRSPNDIEGLKGWLSYYFTLIEKHLSKNLLQLPGLKSRFHNGFEPEDIGSRSYYSGFYIKDEKKIFPSPDAVDKNILFIVNKNAEVPRIAFALQKAGKTKIMSPDSINDALLVEKEIFELNDSVSVRIRLNEIYNTDIIMDYIIPPDMGQTEVLKMAIRLMNDQSDSYSYNKNNKEVSPTINMKQIESDSFYPALGHRLLAAAKIWTVIHYFFAYKHLMEEDWNDILKEYILPFALASDSLSYHLTVAEMYKHIQDGHGKIRSKVINHYFGTACPPIVLRYIENHFVVTNIFPDSIYAVNNIEVGDIILDVDSEKLKNRANRITNYIAASNKSALFNYISRVILNGQENSDVKLKIKKQDGEIKKITLPRKKKYNKYYYQYRTGRNHLPIYQLINPDIGYADLDRLTIEMVEPMFKEFKKTKGIIFDMRGYPKGTAWSIAPYLTSKEKVFAANFKRFSPMGINLGAYENIVLFDQKIPPPKSPTYHGLTVMLIDERTQSQAEHTGLFFEAANNTKFIGSQTAGANGDITSFNIPGNITLLFSGHDVRHIDGRQLQKIGLVPDVKVKPTIAGIGKGKDEVLDKAKEYMKILINKKSPLYKK